MFHAACTRPKARYPLGPTTRAIITARKPGLDSAWEAVMGIPFRSPRSDH
jgi:hypothetical protein